MGTRRTSNLGTSTCNGSLWWRVGDGPLWSEALIVGLSLVGCVAGLLPGYRGLGDAHEGFVRWLACYTIMVTAIYTVIPYKTPWCLLQFLLGMVMLAGVGVSVLLHGRATAGRAVVLSCCCCWAQATWPGRRIARATFWPPTCEIRTCMPDVQPTCVRLADQLQQLAEASDQRTMPVKVIWSDAYYWPLPWYLRRFSQVEWWTRLPEIRRRRWCSVYRSTTRC